MLRQIERHVSSILLIICIIKSTKVVANNSDRFFYGETDRTTGGASDYGQPNWERVTCDDVGACVSTKGKA
jgi:hypothetical protein